MEPRSEILHFRRYIKLFGALLAVFACSSVSQAAELKAAHHIQIELIPAEKKLNGRDDITLQAGGVDILEFRLSERITQLRVRVNRKRRHFDFKNGRLQLSLKPAEKSDNVQVSIDYSGIFDDPVPLLPVNTDNPGFGVTGTVSERGCFLLAGAGWYPELVDSRATYRLEVKAPAGIVAVTAGKSLGHVTENGMTLSAWEVNEPTEGLSLSAAPYVVERRSVGKVTASTYFLPSNRHLASSYLEACAKFIKLYSDLFGPYPFQKFAVVENFFPTGYGFPSYTLMGGRVLRLPFIVHTSLGHEIAHCWWGNAVYVDYSEGNWSEGLTTYVADFLFQEMKSEKAAADYRRQWLRNYSTLVRPGNDVALNRFRSRFNPVSKTIGYDKSAMVFHMLRQQLGEDAFWGALRDIYRDRLFRRTSWSDLRHAFEKRCNCSLLDFFNQWVFHKGAPQFKFDSVRAEGTGQRWKVSGRIIQNDPFFNFPLTIALEIRAKTMNTEIRVSGKVTPFELTCDDRPLKITADPDYDIFRKLYASEIPHSVNALKSSPSVVIVVPEKLDTDTEHTARTLVLSLGLKNIDFVTENELSRQSRDQNDILLIGCPRRKELLQKLPVQAAVRSKSFTLNNKTYDRASQAFFCVFEHPYAKNRVAALFMPLSSRYADIVARKITHYGRYSYLAFENGKNLDKGYWPVKNSPLVYAWDQDSIDKKN
jgi:hypothetical protein